MLTSTQKDALQTVKEIGAEIDTAKTIDALRWAVANLSYEAKQCKVKEDSDLITDQIRAIVDCMSWACQIHSCSEELRTEERRADLQEQKGGASC